MADLTPRERLDRCYRRQETDLPGIFLRGISKDRPSHPSYAPLRELATSHAEQKRSWSVWSLVSEVPVEVTTNPHDDDWAVRTTVLHTPAGDLTSEAFVGRHGQPGLSRKYLLGGPEDAEVYLSQPLPEPAGELEDYFAAAQKQDRRGIVEIGLGFNPAGHVAELFGTEKFAFMSVEHREVLHRLMERRLEAMMRLLRYAIERGGGPYFAMLGEEYVLPPMHGPEDFRDFNLRYDKPIADAIHSAGGLLHVHCHGPLKQVLDGFLEIGPDALHPFEAPPMGDITPSEASRAVGGRICYEGNIQIGEMIEGEPDAIRTQVRNLVEQVWLPHKRGLIVAPTASPYVPVMSERMFRNYKTLVETVSECTR